MAVNCPGFASIANYDMLQEAPVAWKQIMKLLVERLAEVSEHIEELSRRIVRLRKGEIAHQTRIGDGPWEDSTDLVLSQYENMLANYKSIADELRERIRSGQE